ncbi:MAG: hypothetical protein ACK56W_17340 [Pirellula sp.]|jgi:hypothetical protein|nr:hypothetical protein [Pirellula sp.]
MKAEQQYFSSTDRGFGSAMNVVVRSIGVLLIVAAFLKIWMLITDPFADLKVSISREVLCFASFVELYVGGCDSKLPTQQIASEASIVSSDRTNL